MLVVGSPRFGVHYQPGDVFFTRRPGNILTKGISLATGKGPTHCGVVGWHGRVIEAYWPKVRQVEFEGVLDDPDVLVWIKTPRDQNSQTAWRIVEAMMGKVGADYDLSEMIGFPAKMPQTAHDRQEWFCSELVAWALGTQGPLPVREYVTKADGKPDWDYWSPADLFKAPIWAE